MTKTTVAMGVCAALATWLWAATAAAAPPAGTHGEGAIFAIILGVGLGGLALVYLLRAWANRRDEGPPEQPT